MIGVKKEIINLFGKTIVLLFFYCPLLVSITRLAREKILFEIERMKGKVKMKLKESQYGFSSRRGTDDAPYPL